MAIEDQIPTLVVLVSTLIGIGWYAIRDNREKMQKVEKELCKLRENMTEMVTELLDKYEKHEAEDRRYFHEIFNTLAETRGRESARKSPI